MPAKCLVIIESPGKSKKLQASLDYIDLNADVFATKGHLYQNPSSLYPLGIDSSFKEYLRSPVSALTINLIKSKAGQYKYILIATDPDHEGDVIASDIARLLPNERLLRVKFGGLDPDSVANGITLAKPLDDSLSWPGTSRRIVDRLIGSLLSSPVEKVYVGRVRSAIMGLIDRQAIQTGHFHMTMEDEGGGPDFHAKIPITRDNFVESRNLYAKYEAYKAITKTNLRSSVIESIEHLDSPWNMNECIIHCAEKLDVDIVQVYDSMQRLYQNGALSYIRSSSKGVGLDALACLEKISDIHGAKNFFRRDRLTKFSENEVHEAPRPLVMVDISMPLKLLDFDDAVLSIITRNLIKCGIKSRTDIANTSNLPTWAQDLKWERTVYPPLPWQEPKVESGIHKKKKKVALLAALNHHKLGRPSTIVSHASKFIESDYVDQDFRLTEEGLRALHHTPPILMDTKTSVLIEQALSAIDMEPSKKIPHVLEMLGEEVSGGIYESIAADHLKQSTSGLRD